MLAHYGIVGMKWGIRRYQNPDGSYTTAGKARYSSAKEFKKDLKADRRKAEANSIGLATTDAALRISNARLVKAQKAVDKVGGYDAASNRKRLRLDVEAETNSKLAKDFSTAKETAYAHMNELIDKYGEQNVKKIREGRSSGYASEYDSSPAMVKAAVTSVLMSVGFTGAMIASGIPFMTIFTPQTAQDRGRMRYGLIRKETEHQLKYE